jgi:class 3 adenylate cyclase
MTSTRNIESAAVFADLCDYTRLTEQLGDEAAADMAVALGDIARTVARRHNGAS